jgi:hypothetical protein
MGVYTEQDLDDLMKENIRLARENNKLLRKMRRDAIVGRFVKLIMLAVIIATPFVLYYYFVEPYVAEMRETYAELQGNLDTVEQLKNEFPSFPQWLSGVFAGNNDSATSTPDDASEVEN